MLFLRGFLCGSSGVVFGDRVFRWGFVVRFWVGAFGVVGVSEVGELSAGLVCFLMFLCSVFGVVCRVGFLE